MSHFRSSLRSAPTNEQAWGSLFKSLSSRNRRPALDEIRQNYERLCAGWELPRTNYERAELQKLRAVFNDCVEPFVERTALAILQLGLPLKAPSVSSIIAREEHFRVRRGRRGLEVALLGELRDDQGHSLVWHRGTLSSPSRNPMMLRIRSGAEAQNTLQYDILYSHAAFLEEIEVTALLVESFEPGILLRPLLPVTLHALVAAAAESLCLENGAAQIDRIRVSRSTKDTTSFLVSSASKRCCVRLTMRPTLPFPITRTSLL